MQRRSKQNNLKIHRGLEIIIESQNWLGTGLLISGVAYLSWINHGLIIIKTISSMVIIKTFQSHHFYWKLQSLYQIVCYYYLFGCGFCFNGYCLFFELMLALVRIFILHICTRNVYVLNITACFVCVQFWNCVCTTCLIVCMFERVYVCTRACAWCVVLYMCL